MKKLVLLLAYIIVSTISYSQSLKNNLGLDFGASLTEVSNKLKVGRSLGRSGQIPKSINIEEIGNSYVLFLFKEKRLNSIFVKKDCYISDAAHTYNTCAASLGVDFVITDEDIYLAEIGSSIKREFEIGGVKGSMYLYKYGGFKFFGGGTDIRTSIIINYYKDSD